MKTYFKNKNISEATFFVLFIVAVIFASNIGSKFGDNLFSIGFELEDSFLELSNSSLSLLDSIGNGTIRVYRMQGNIIYNSLVDLDDLGYGVIIVYEFTGKVFYEGIKDVGSSYKNMFGNVFAFDTPKLNIEEKISTHFANVSIGLDIVKIFTREKISLFAKNTEPVFSLVNGASLNNIEKATDEISYLKNDIRSASVSGTGKIFKDLRKFSQDFVLNIKKNFLVIGRGVETLTSSVSSGFHNLFSIETLPRIDASQK